MPFMPSMPRQAEEVALLAVSLGNWAKTGRSTAWQGGAGGAEKGGPVELGNNADFYQLSWKMAVLNWENNDSAIANLPILEANMVI